MSSMLPFVIIQKLKTTWLCTIKLIISFQFSLLLWFNFRNQSNHVKNFFSPTRIYYSAMLKARISCFQNHDSQVFFSYDLYKIKKVGGKYSCMRQRQRQMWWYCVTNWFIYMTKQNSVIRVIYLFNIITQLLKCLPLHLTITCTQIQPQIEFINWYIVKNDYDHD